jgi:hypothetical protein
MDIAEELDFRTVFPADNKNPYSRIIVDKIQANRTLLDNELFFDNLLISFAKLKDGARPHDTAPFRCSTANTCRSYFTLPTQIDRHPQGPFQPHHNLTAP